MARAQEEIDETSGLPRKELGNRDLSICQIRPLFNSQCSILIRCSGYADIGDLLDSRSHSAVIKPRRANIKETKMARFVLVHGAFAGAWIWGSLMDRLKAAGRSVEAFDLPGLGDDRTPASEITLDTCAARLCEVLEKSSE